VPPDCCRRSCSAGYVVGHRTHRQPLDRSRHLENPAGRFESAGASGALAAAWARAAISLSGSVQSWCIQDTAAQNLRLCRPIWLFRHLLRSISVTRPASGWVCGRGTMGDGAVRSVSGPLGSKRRDVDAWDVPVAIGRWVKSSELHTFFSCGSMRPLPTWCSAVVLRERQPRRSVAVGGPGPSNALN